MSVIPLSHAATFAAPPVRRVDPPFAHQLLERMLEHFFPDATLYRLGPAPEHADVDMALVSSGHLAFNWFGIRYGLARERPLSVLERLLVDTVTTVLLDRTGAALQAETDRQTRMRGSLEDRCVATFVASGLSYQSAADQRTHIDTLTAAFEVVRRAAAATHENRRITTGVLLAVPGGAPRSPVVSARDRAVRYEWPLRNVKTVCRLCDGVRTLAVVDGHGHLVSVAEVTANTGDNALPYPVSPRHAAHASATLDGRHVCLVLNASGVIHVFANGVQVFSLSESRWRLRGTGEKFVAWESAVGSRPLADRLLRTAIALSEERHGALFAVADDDDAEERLISPIDRLAPPRVSSVNAAQPYHYLFRGTHVLTMPPALLQTAASIDGAVVLARNGDLVAVGAILRGDGGIVGVEGARTTAAIAASRCAAVLKVSEDGEISMFSHGRRVWTL